MRSNSLTGILQNLEISAIASESLNAINDVEETRVSPAGAYAETTLLMAIELTSGLAALVTRKRFDESKPDGIE